MKISLLIIITLLCLSCSEDPTNTVTNSGGNPASFFRIEKEPTLSYDRSTLLMIRADTALTTNNGIYSADYAHPVRVLELLGENYKSPTVAVNKNIIAFIDGPSLKLYDKNIDTVYSLHTGNFYSNIFFINDSTLIGQSGSTLYSTDIINNSTSVFSAGIFPVAYFGDTLAFLNSIGGASYTINLGVPLLFRMKSLSSTVILDTINDVQPLSFGIEPILKRFCYTVAGDSGYTIKAGAVGIDSTWVVATSKFHKVIMLDSQTILFTGEDGRLYRTNFSGTATYPYWEAVNSDG